MILHSAKVGISSHWHRNLYCSYHVPYLLQKIEEQTPTCRARVFFFWQAIIFRAKFSTTGDCTAFFPALLAYLQERGINIAMAKRECSEAHFTHNGKRYFAIAFPMCRGGYECNQHFKGCIAPKEISHIKQPGNSEGNMLCV